MNRLRGRRCKGLEAGTSRVCSAYTWCLIFGYNLALKALKEMDV